MKKTVMIAVVLLLLCVVLTAVFFGGNLSEPTLDDVIDEKQYIIQKQESVAITFSVPKAELSEEIYSAAGQSFKPNQIVVYETENTTIYLEGVQFSNEGEDLLYFLFNCAYTISDEGSVLVPYKKIEDGFSCSEFQVIRTELIDDVTTYPDAVKLRGCGAGEQLALYVSADACKKAKGTMKMQVCLNEMTYVRSK